MEYLHILMGGFLVLMGILSQKLSDKSALNLVKEELANKQVLINQFADLTAQLYTVQHQEQTSVSMPTSNPMDPREHEVESEIQTMFAGEMGGQN